MTILIAMNVAPRGLPICLRWVFCDFWWWDGEEEDNEVLRRKSWVMAMPMEANEREVRSQARKVRSVYGVSLDGFRVRTRCWRG
jgi:hypothetical protein